MSSTSPVIPYGALSHSDARRAAKILKHANKMTDPLKARELSSLIMQKVVVPWANSVFVTSRTALCLVAVATPYMPSPMWLYAKKVGGVVLETVKRWCGPDRAEVHAKNQEHLQEVNWVMHNVLEDCRKLIPSLREVSRHIQSLEQVERDIEDAQKEAECLLQHIEAVALECQSIDFKGVEEAILEVNVLWNDPDYGPAFFNALQEWEVATEAWERASQRAQDAHKRLFHTTQEVNAL